MKRRDFLNRIAKTAPIAVIGVAGLGTLAATKLPLNKTVITSKTWNPKPIDLDALNSKMWNPVEVGERIRAAYSNIPRDLLDPSLDYHIEHTKLLNRIEIKHLLG